MGEGFRSKAQRTKWEQLVRDGRVTQAQFDRRDEESDDSLPDRATPRRRTVGPSRSADAAKINDERY